MVYAGETRESNCPLGQYMMGRYQIETKTFLEYGKQRVAKAASYRYWKGVAMPNLYCHLELFKDEIINYYNKKER